MLLRLSYLDLTGIVACLRLLPLSSTDKDIEILVLGHQLSILQEAKKQGWLGEVAAIETSMAAAAQKLGATRNARATPVHLGMPDVRSSAGRSSAR